MKIGILTHFCDSINYGGVLQAYALCKYLNDRDGYSAEQILYKHGSISVGDSKMTCKEFFKKLKSLTLLQLSIIKVSITDKSFKQLKSLTGTESISNNLKVLQNLKELISVKDKQPHKTKSFNFLQ
jgi:hypothetical protein